MTPDQRPDKETTDPRTWRVGKYLGALQNPQAIRVNSRLQANLSRAFARFDQFQNQLREQSPSLYLEDATPRAARDYWHRHVASAPDFTPLQECLAVLLLDAGAHIFAHRIVGLGLVDTVPFHAREVFRPAILGGASMIVLAHNHPSGKFLPSENDIAATQKLRRAGQIIGIELADHIILGEPHRIGKAVKDFASLRELGYFYER